MKILMVHNFYQRPGGEDVVLRSEKALLSSAGHQVTEFTRHNREIEGFGLWDRLMLAPRTVWAWDSRRALKNELARSRPDVVHFHNFFPLVSPAAYSACREAGIPVVQTLHNFRLVCPSALLFRDGRPCEECLQHNLWRGIQNACYRDSRLATATVALMLAVHRRLGTFAEGVDGFIALSEFSREKFVQAGLPADKIVLKPNFVHPDPGPGAGPGTYALYVGRLSSEKGLGCLLEAWGKLGAAIPLRILGDGPLRGELRRQADRLGLSGVSFEGHRDREQVAKAMQAARLLVFPSLWYETFGMAIVEAFACGLPVVASRLGTQGELVEDGLTGRLFAPGDPADLAEKVGGLWTDETLLAEMGQRARARFEARYTAARSAEILLGLYSRICR